MKKILIVQSRTSHKRIQREQSNFRNSIGEKADIAFLSALDERLSWTTPEEFLRGFDGVIFGGSSDFDFHGGRSTDDPVRLISLMILSRSKNLISYALAQKVPLLAVCYGHQLIANMYGGKVLQDKSQSKFGSYEVELTDEGKRDMLFKHLPASFVAQYAHNDSVTELPDGATLLASSAVCRFSALRYGERAYTLQFHPEVVQFDDLQVEAKPSLEASKIVPLWVEECVVSKTAPRSRARGSVDALA
jgi:GMP synthase-like glutamine amidotransferase